MEVKKSKGADLEKKKHGIFLFSLVIATGFLLTYFDVWKRPKGALGQEIWWNDVRPFHAGLYMGFAYLAINNDTRSYQVLLADLILGLYAHTFIRN